MNPGRRAARLGSRALATHKNLFDFPFSFCLSSSPLRIIFPLYIVFMSHLRILPGKMPRHYFSPVALSNIAYATTDCWGHRGVSSSQIGSPFTLLITSRRRLLDTRRTRSLASKLPSVMEQKALRAVFA